LLHECFIAMYQYPKEELEFIRQKGELFFFGARIMSLMYHSKTSRYYYKIKKYNQQHIDDQDTNLIENFLSYITLEITMAVNILIQH